jgi:flagellar assembly factor FliW
MATVVIDHPEGQLEVPVSAVVRLVEPLYGFPERLDYALIPAAREGLWWFISVEQPTATFIVADPFPGKPDYQVELAAPDLEGLHADGPNDVLALVLLDLNMSEGKSVTANMRAPLLLNLHAHAAKQALLADERLSLTEPFSLAAYPLIES